MIIKGKDWKIYVGDTREGLAAMPANSVHCCITSPPYWGLRDYGTADWEGGDPNCDHIDESTTKSHITSTLWPNKDGCGPNNAAHKSKHRQFDSVCDKCGARRIDRQLGLEPLHDCLAWAQGLPPCGACYVCGMRTVFAAVARVLRHDGVLWLNLGDSYANDPKKGRSGKGKNAEYLGGVDETAQTRRPSTRLPNGNLVGIPWRVALALQADGWVLRSEIIWWKRSAMPESVKSRCSKAHEQVFMFAKGPGYYYDPVPIQEPQVSTYKSSSFIPKSDKDAQDGGDSHNAATTASANNRSDEDINGLRNKRTVWDVTTVGTSEAHYAPFPPKLIEPMVLAGTSEKGCCAKCGAPYKRITEREQITRERPNDYVKRIPKSHEKSQNTPGNDPYSDKSTLRETNTCANTVAGVTIKTVGWQAGCECNAAVVPCVVLDPFLGSGTTVAEALKHHRRGIGCELNPDYVEIAQRKIEKGRLNRGFF